MGHAEASPNSEQNQVPRSWLNERSQRLPTGTTAARVPGRNLRSAQPQEAVGWGLRRVRAPVSLQCLLRATVARLPVHGKVRRNPRPSANCPGSLAISIAARRAAAATPLRIGV